MSTVHTVHSRPAVNRYRTNRPQLPRQHSVTIDRLIFIFAFVISQKMNSRNSHFHISCFSAEKKIPSHILLGVNQLVYDRYLCTAIYERNGISIDTNKGQLCVGGKVGKDSCNGDSGGPLMWMGSFDRSISARTYLLGIVSLGPSTCGMLRIPGVYTRTSYFLRWILDNMQE